MKKLVAVAESPIERMVFQNFPNILTGFLTIGSFLFRATNKVPSAEYSSFQLFIILAISNLLLWITFKGLDREKSHKDNSGYLIFYVLCLCLPYLLITSATIDVWDLCIFGLILVYRLAYRLRYGGFPVLSIIFNSILMYLLFNQFSITWLLPIYYGAQLIEVVIESKLQSRWETITRTLGGWLFIGYVVYLILLLGKII